MSNTLKRWFPGCTIECTVVVPCPVCGRDLPPRGRDVSPYTYMPDCCDEHRYDKINTRHLWSRDEFDELMEEEKDDDE